MFEGWDDFYLLIGSAGGALIGLMFVVATLSIGGDRDRATRGQRLYMTPTVVDFGVVLVVSAMAMAKEVSISIEALIVGGCGLFGSLYSLRVAIDLFRSKQSDIVPHWSDPWWYGVGPTVIYAALVGSACAVAGHEHRATYAVATVMTVLLLVAIRNAWDLVTWLAPAAKPEGEGQPPPQT